MSKKQVAEFWPAEERAAILNGPPWNLQVAKFWDVQEPRYSLVQGPAWLKLDEATGLLTGTPAGSGKVEVVVGAVLQRKVEELDLDRLAWGQIKVTGVTTEKMGPDIQKFTIEVGQ